MILFPNAKINLGLSVLEKGTDGFHDILTVLYPVPFFDVLEVFPSSGKGTRLNISGIDLDSGPAENLCYRAWHLMHEEFGISPVELYLHKAIPPGAGLGGGSADAAFTLKALDKLFGLELGEITLSSLAGRLGSDCPFFIRNQCSLASGRGDEFQDSSIDLSGLFLVLVKPPLHISTAAAYDMVSSTKEKLFPGARGPMEKPDQAKSGETQVQLSSTGPFNPAELPMEQWNGKILNDFEEALFGEYPILKEMKEKLYSTGALYASLTGSGSALYGLYERKPGVRGLFMPDELLWQGWL